MLYKSIAHSARPPSVHKLHEALQRYESRGQTDQGHVSVHLKGTGRITSARVSMEAAQDLRKLEKQLPEAVKNARELMRETALEERRRTLRNMATGSDVEGVLQKELDVNLESWQMPAGGSGGTSGGPGWGE
eukprot:gb/GECH01006331.1/.p1 GENE.gb/GECH01006331.1/~~gb/GECH01006331.1/.p1  ORF type:complete len:132 (+),score=25.07 gb/GECH01006331.1/:1-396(+)